MENDFPSLPDTSYEISYVDKALEEFLSPAFYITAPIDNYNQNSIYINNSSIYTDIYRWMLETDLIENVAIRLKSGQQRPYLRRYGGKLCLYPSAEGINMERLDRDKVLQMLYNKGLVQLKDEDIFSQPDGGRLFLKGWGINFTYKGYRFYWNWGNKLYINDLEYKLWTNIIILIFQRI